MRFKGQGSASTKMADHKVTDKFNQEISELDEGQQPPVFVSLATILTPEALLRQYGQRTSFLIGALVTLPLLATPWPELASLGLFSAAAVLWFFRGWRPWHQAAQALKTIKSTPPEIVVAVDRKHELPDPENAPPPLFVQLMLVARLEQALATKHRMMAAAALGIGMGTLVLAAIAHYSLPVWAASVLPAAVGILTLSARARYWKAEKAAQKLGDEAELAERY